MKSNICMLVIALLLITSCQPKTKITPVDVAAVKDNVTRLLEKFDSGMKSKNATELISLFTDDCLVCGTDPKELLNKEDWTNMMTQAFADTTMDMNYNVDKRIINISKDGNSAMALEQMFLRSISEKIPCRIVYHAVKTNNEWQFNFVSFSFIPENEDIPKLNKALE